MRYVGFSEYYHDAALSIINKDGTVEFASQAERFSKKKNDPIIPESLWEYVNDNDHVSFYEDYALREKYRDTYRGLKGKTLQRDISTHEEIPIGESLVYDNFHEHHISHCATAFYTRPWKDKEDTVMVSIDGAGEYQTAVIYDHNFNLIKEWHYPKSIGLVYTSATKTLGLRPLEDEYVVMGLSSYGTAPPEMVQWLIDWWEDTPDVSTGVGKEVLLDHPDSPEYVGFQRMRNKLIDFAKQYGDKDFAAGIQKFAEYGIMQIMHIAKQHEVF